MQTKEAPVTFVYCAKTLDHSSGRKFLFYRRRQRSLLNVLFSFTSYFFLLQTANHVLFLSPSSSSHMQERKKKNLMNRFPPIYLGAFLWSVFLCSIFSCYVTETCFYLSKTVVGLLSLKEKRKSKRNFF